MVRNNSETRDYLRFDDFNEVYRGPIALLDFLEEMSRYEAKGIVSFEKEMLFIFYYIRILNLPTSCTLVMYRTVE